MDIEQYAHAPRPVLGNEDAVRFAVQLELHDHDGRAQRGHPLTQRSSAAPSAMKKPAASPA